MEESAQIPLSFATCSISSGDTALDSLPQKLEAISSAGFNAIELAFPDLLAFASQILERQVAADDYADLCMAAAKVALQCNKLNLKILMLQPFVNFEGWRRGSKEWEDAFKRARGWIRIMESCGTDMLQVWPRLSIYIY
jgi:sugar phosphate isomerase/epimerase